MIENICICIVLCFILIIFFEFLYNLFFWFFYWLLKKFDYFYDIKIIIEIWVCVNKVVDVKFDNLGDLF